MYVDDHWLKRNNLFCFVARTAWRITSRRKRRLILLKLKFHIHHEVWHRRCLQIFFKVFLFDAFWLERGERSAYHPLTRELERSCGDVPTSTSLLAMTGGLRVGWSMLLYWYFWTPARRLSQHCLWVSQLVCWLPLESCQTIPSCCLLATSHLWFSSAFGNTFGTCSARQSWPSLTNWQFHKRMKDSKSNASWGWQVFWITLESW